MRVALLILFSLFLFSCSNVVKVKEDYYPNGSIKIRQSYIMNEPDGFLIGYYENGNMSDSSSIKKGKYNGISKNFYEDGTLKSVAYCNNGSIVGKKLMYHTNGKVFVEGFYKDNILNGVQKTFDDDGHLWRVCNYDNGKIADFLKIFYPGGQLRKKFVFDRGSMPTMREVYYRDGNVKLRTYYQYDGSVLKETRYDEEGNLLPSDSLIVSPVSKLESIHEGDTMVLRINFVCNVPGPLLDKQIVVGQMDDDDSLYVENHLTLINDSYAIYKTKAEWNGRAMFSGMLKCTKNGKAMEVPFIWSDYSRGGGAEISRAKENFE